MFVKLAVPVLAGVLILGASACGNGESDDTAPGTPTTSAGAAAPGAPEPAVRGCEPVGTDLEGSADETVAVALDEYSFDPSTVEVAVGTVTFAATNVGEEEHELAFLPGGGDIPLTGGGEPDEDALAAAGAFELEAFGPGQTCNATYELTAGAYTLFCIVQAADGETHLAKGMRGQLVVE